LKLLSLSSVEASVRLAKDRLLYEHNLPAAKDWRVTATIGF
jgi:hypothetical protein